MSLVIYADDEVKIPQEIIDYTVARAARLESTYVYVRQSTALNAPYPYQFIATDESSDIPDGAEFILAHTTIVTPVYDRVYPESTQ